ncbi:dynein associated protein-domain-containing protein [Cokeromyces recurvatus]|uniref:dynein associated protein-domain-containing protein n=1 Tax=Cokeromyces recurvatus TaxID=90255 RepID=UPI00221F5F85|nr:dynein associated protein-domain-containing protein [Cokeromyces recurvatus]KAI7898739.1 dynein associated protein-domain-containing protein [Cokeromyces recurvatus]
MSGMDPQQRRSSFRNSSPNTIMMNSELKVGMRAQVQGKMGWIRFVGITSFQTGKWIGIELDEPQGKNSGVVQGKRYFECKTNHGVFVRPSQVKLIHNPSLTTTTTTTSMSPLEQETSSLTTKAIPSSSRISRLPNLMNRKSSTILSTQPKSVSITPKKNKTPLMSQNNVQQEEMEVNKEEDSSLSVSEEIIPSSSSSSSITTTTTAAAAALPPPPQQSYGSLLSIHKSDPIISFKEYEELRLKLKILEAKRQEDRERYREYEKIKEEAEQFLTLRNKLQDKISELQRELRETRRELKESNDEKENYEVKYNDVIESLEMITLDKEVAEERAEHLQQEVNVLKDKIEEIGVDLDVLRKEADIINRVSSEGGGDQKTSLEFIQLERHNERLKEALVRLRDATTARENELCDRIKELEKESYVLDDVKKQYDKIHNKLELSELTIEELKQRLDDALGAEDLVEQLTEKNLSLTEKIEEMHLIIEDLEALKELADELEENHIENEKQLQAEIDHRDMLLREQLERLRSSEETNADYETTIQQFRELVTTLQNDLEQLRFKEVSQQSEKQTLSSQSQAMMSLHMQLQSTVMKAQAKAIDLELRKLDAAQANDRLNCIQPYLPDSFFRTENDAISCLLLFKRLVFKTELIIKHLDQNYPISEKIMDIVPESLIAVCEMRQRAGWLSDISKRFVTFIKNCQPAMFIKMGQVYHDLMGAERRLTSLVELMRMNEINELECVVELQRIIAQLEHLSEIHLVQNEANHFDQFFGLTRALDLNADRIIVELTFVKQALDCPTQNENINIIEGRQTLDYDYLEPLGRLVSQAKNSKVLAKKIVRQLEDLSEQALTLRPEYLHQFRMLFAISSKLGKFCYETYKQISAYISAKMDSKEDISLSMIQQIVYNKADEVLEIAESSMWEACLKTLKSLTNELGSTIEQISNENKTEKIITTVAPWVQRASDIKAEVIINHDMERKLQQHSDEIVKLIKDVKIKDQALQESNVKIELLKKRMEIVKKQAEQINSLEETLSKVQGQEQMYAEAMENLQIEYDALEQENTELKKNALKNEEKRFSSVIRYLRSENAHLKGLDIARSLQLHQQPFKKLNDAKDFNLDKPLLGSFALERRMLVKDIRTVSASLKVVQLSSHYRAGKWQSEKRLPDYQYQTQQSVLYTLKQRYNQLRHKIAQDQKDTPSQQILLSTRKAKLLKSNYQILLLQI